MSLIERVIAYQEAHNQHNLDATLGMLADDISFEMVDVWTKVGLDNMRSLEEFDTGVNGSLIFNDFATNENMVEATAIENNDWFRITGIGEVKYSMVKFTFREQQICKIRAVLTPESFQAISEKLQSVTGWAAREQTQHLEKLMPQGEFIYNSESAKEWMVLLRKWRDIQNHHTA
jgi:hypothetical protein